MSCDEFRSLLNDHVDGELSPSETVRFEAHLSECEACRAERAELVTLLENVGRLDRQLSPERELWGGIERRIGSGGRVVRGPWRSSAWLGWAAAAVLVVVVGVQMSREAAPVSEPAVAKVEDAAVPAVLSSSEVALASDEARARDGLILVRSDLLRSIEERRASLDPAAAALVDENLRVIDRAIADIYNALQEDPENRGLEFLLASTYQREVEFLKQMNLL